MDNHAIAGSLAGAATSILLHPIDVVKVRFQVQDGVSNAVLYTRVRTSFSQIVHAEGFRGLYRGAVAAAVGSGASWGLYFYLYEMCKRRLTPTPSTDARGAPVKLSPLVHMYAAWEAGALTCFATNPIWLVKTRLQLQTGSTAAELRDKPYRGMVDAFMRIVREEGPFALYKGLIPALALVFHGSVQFGVYEELKHTLAGPIASPAWGSATLLAIGGISKIAAVTVTYPAQVVKSRLQQRVSSAATPEYAGVIDCVRKMLLREGAAGFYKGFVANLLRVTPSSALTLTAYEHAREALRTLNPSGEAHSHEQRPSSSSRSSTSAGDSAARQEVQQAADESSE